MEEKQTAFLYSSAWETPPHILKLGFFIIVVFGGLVNPYLRGLADL